MKKIVYNLLFVVVLSLSFLGIAKAESHIELTRVMSNTNGKIVIASAAGSAGSEGIYHLKCTDYKTKETKTVSTKTKVEVAKGIVMYVEDGVYVLEANNQDVSKNLSLSCSYEGAPYYLTDNGSAGAGTLTTKLTFTDDYKSTFDYNITMNALSNKEKRVTGTNTPFSGFESKNYKFQSCEVDDTSSRYITCRRVGSEGKPTGVQIKLKDGLDLSEPVEVDAEVSYKDSKNKEYFINVHVTIVGTTKIIANFGGAKCSAWPAGWKNFDIDTNQIKNKDVLKVYEYSGGTIPLPTCEYTGTDGLVYTFKGWHIHDGAEDGNTTVPFGVCAQKGAVMGSIDYSTNGKDLRYDRFITTCFEEEPIVIVDLKNVSGKLASGSGYTAMKGDKLAFQYYKKADSSGKAVLPSVTYEKNSGKIFGCWRSQDTGTCYKPGDSVPSGIYVLEDGEDEDYSDATEIKQYKTMVLGATDTLKPASITKMTLCSSDNSEYISARYDSDKGECVVSAKKETGNNRVNVIISGTKGENEIKVISAIRVIKNDDATQEGAVLKSDNGQVYSVTGFYADATEAPKKCKNFQISPQLASNKSDLFTIIEKLSFARSGNSSKKYEEPINDNVYSGSGECDGKTVKIAAVCIDPSRQQPPSSGANYILDHQTVPDGSYLDKLTIVLYGDPSYRDAINNVANGSIGSNEKQAMATATLAYRILAIKAGESANDDDAGLSDQFHAYKALTSAINKKWGSSIDNWVTNSKNANISEDYAYNVFCSGSNSCSGTVRKDVLKNALILIKKALHYDRDFTKISVNAYVAGEDTDISGDGKYTKVIEGKFTDIPTKSSVVKDHFLSVRPTCESCSKYISSGALSVKFEIGRDLTHLVEFDETMNILNVKYGDFNKYKDDAAYKDKYLYNSDGTMVFRYTITGDVNKISQIAHSSRGVSYGSGVGGSGTGGGADDLREKADEFKISTSIGVDGEEYKLNTGQANSSGSANFQRMEIFNNIEGHREKTSGGPGSGQNPSGVATGTPCGDNCGWERKGSGSPGFDLRATPAVTIQYNGPNGVKNMIIDYNTMDLGTFLPACDASTPKYNYKSCTSNENCTASGFDPYLFVGAGCCSRILDETHHVYKTYCNNRCTQSSYTPICKNDEAKPAGVYMEKLKLHEATKSDGVEDFTCIYNNSDTAATRISETKKKKDSVGNKYSHNALSNNNICAISCKEDWDFTVPSLSNHLGPNAVVAGQYFVLGRDTVKTVGKRTCITTKIDIQSWSSQICSLSSAMVRAFNQQNMMNMFNSITASGSNGLFDRLSFNESEEYKYCEDTYGKDYICSKKYCGDGDSNDDGDCDDYGEYYSTDTTDYVEKCPSGYTKTDDWQYNKERCSKGEMKTCKNLESVTGPTIEYEYYTFSCGGGVGTVNGAYQINDNNIPKNFKPGDNYSEDGHGECEKEPISKDNYKEKRGEALLSKAKGEIQRITGAAYDADADWTGYASQISGLLSDMKECQYWGLSIRNNNRIKDDSETKFKIQTEFNPRITYSYDEPGFMDQLAGHNTLQKQDKEYVFSYDYYGPDNFNAKSYTGEYASSGSHGKYKFTVDDDTSQSNALIKGTGIQNLTRNVNTNFQPFAVCTNGGSGSSRVGPGKTGEGGGTVSWNVSAGCGTGFQEYIRNAYYIKRTASLSSEYESDDYKWYIDTLNGFRQLGKDASDAMKKSKSPNKNDASKWAVYAESGNKGNMVFPIAETTPRNIYQYSFSFYNVGNYNDNSKSNLGRIMGTNKSVIGNNNRVCFYEVIEGVCYCCGDVLETELVAVSGRSTAELLNKSQTTGRDNTTGTNTTCRGNDCNDYLSSYTLSKPIKKEDIDKNSGDSIYNISVNSVSLNSIKKDAGRTIGANWSTGQHYILEGFVYATDKGAKLLTNIEENGENIYDTSTGGSNVKYPEYSYTLSPTALSVIRNNNGENGYQEKSASMEVYGYTKLYSDSNKSWNATKTDTAMAHYASKFLDNTVSAYVTKEYQNRVLSRLTKSQNPICYVVGYDGKTGFQFGASGNVYKGNGQHVNSATDCRWIDFVGEVKKADDYTSDNAGSLNDGKHFYRLSFK